MKDDKDIVEVMSERKSTKQQKSNKENQKARTS